MAALSFGSMTFELDGKRVALDIATVKTSEWKVIKSYTGKKPFEMLTEIDDPECIEAVYWLVNRRAGNDFAIGSVDFDALTFFASVVLDEDKSEEDSPKG